MRQSSTGGGLKIVAITALVIPAAAIGLYMSVNVSSPVSNLPVTASVTAAQPVSARQPLPAVEEMLAKLETRLEREPEDARGWNLLGRSYEYLGRSEDARKAFEHAGSLGYEGAGASDVVPASVHGLITLDPSLYESVSATDTVFIFARAVSGPRLPVAVLRKQAGDLPFEFRLDDSMAMSPQAKLSQFNQVIIGARISSSGNASASAGDLEGFSGVVTVGDEEAVEIKVDKAVIKSPGVRSRNSPGENTWG
jgi:hypothetical protein